jgi:hypothetical protein
MVIYRLFSIRLAACLLSSLSLLLDNSDAWISKAQAQVESAAGIRRFAKGQWTIVTDLPIDSELESWPVVLDQALASWCQKWSIAPEVAKSWPLTIHCMADRKVFERAGLLDGVPAFEDGFQLADRVFLNEQPSTYYRRHLLLHEATHWVMYRALSGGGSPWFMEGMAEVEGTHRLKDGVLTLAIIPDDRQEVPHWGRFKRLSDSVAKNGVPTLKQILYYGNDRQDRMDRYCWSWAACVFFHNHPLYASYLQKASVAPLDYSLKLSEQLEQTLGDRWDWVERDWKVFVDEFDFGYRPNIDTISLETAQGITATAFSGESSIQLDCSRGWQDSKCFLKAGQKVQIRADGRYVVRNQNQQAWECSADGITYQHFRHIPMGKLLGGFVSVDRDEPLMVFEIGKQTEFVAPRDGWLLLKINEPVRQRQDNSGKLDVRIQS